MAQTQQKQQQRTIHKTPLLSFMWPKLVEPDTKYKPEGVYEVTAKGPANDPQIQKLVALIDGEITTCLEEAKANAKNPAERKRWETKHVPYKMLEDDETGEPTGEISFKFSMKASGVSKKGKEWKRKPVLFDSKGQKITGKIGIGSGTEGIIAFHIQPYSPTTTVGASVSLCLEAVQIVNLVTYGERSASEYGFWETDGFVMSDDDDDQFEDETENQNESVLEDEIPF